MTPTIAWSVLWVTCLVAAISCIVFLALFWASTSLQEVVLNGISPANVFRDDFLKVTITIFDVVICVFLLAGCCFCSSRLADEEDAALRREPSLAKGPDAKPPMPIPEEIATTESSRSKPSVREPIAGSAFSRLSVEPISLDLAAPRRQIAHDAPIGRRADIIQTVAIETDVIEPTNRAGSPGDRGRPSRSRKRSQNLMDNVSVTGRVVVRAEGKEVPIEGALVSAAGYTAHSEIDGTFVLEFPDQLDLGGERLLTVTHDHYVSAACVLADYRDGTPITLEPKRRITFAAFRGSLAGEEFAASRRAIADAIHNRLSKVREFEVKDEEIRDDIIRRLFSIQQGRSVYDLKTLTEVGRERAASHGVFGSVSRTDDGVALSCALANFGTGITERFASIIVPSTTQLGVATEYLVDQLISQLCEIQILSPLDGARCAREARVQGSIRFCPDSWELKLSVKPHRATGHFFQDGITLEDRGIWSTTNVHLGSGRPEEDGDRFDVYPLLVSPMGLESEPGARSGATSPGGIEFDQIERRYLKVFKKVTLTLSDRPARVSDPGNGPSSP